MRSGLRLIALVALLWLVGGWLIGVGIQAQFDVNWVTPCALSNVIIGLVLLLLITRDPRERRIFYEGGNEEEDEDYLPLVTVVLMIPGIEMFVGLVWWGMGWFI